MTDVKETYQQEVNFSGCERRERHINCASAQNINSLSVTKAKEA
jgi:hypothetical protein